MNRRAKNNTREAMERYLREREAAWDDPVLARPEGQIGYETGDGSFRSIEQGRGRPAAFMSNNLQTFQSQQAALFIHEEMEAFRKAHKDPRVTKEVREEFWRIAQRRYPEAVESVVWDRIRMNRRRL